MTRSTAPAEMTYMEPQAAIEQINARMSERAFQWRVVALAKQLGWMTYHTFDSRRSQPGFPDLVLLRERVVWAELKTEKGKLSSAQSEWIECLNGVDQEVYIWRPSDWEGIQETLR